MDAALLSINTVGSAQLEKILIALEPHAIFGSTFAYAFILSLSIMQNGNRALPSILSANPDTIEACIGALGIQDICHFTSRDIGYFPFYFQGYRILCSISGILLFFPPKYTNTQ